MTRKAYRKHKKAMDWFFMEQNGNFILVRDTEDDIWVEVISPSFSEEYDYLINDEYVELRKAIYEGKEIELKEAQTNEWIPIFIQDPNEKFDYCRSMYRAKEKIEYPAFRKDETMVVKFLDEHTMVPVIVFKVNESNKNFRRNFIGKELPDDISCSRWKAVLYDREVELYDGQPVWCWDADNTSRRNLGFYDVKNNNTFHSNGNRNGLSYNHYEPYICYVEPYPHNIDNWIADIYNSGLKF